MCQKIIAGFSIMILLLISVVYASDTSPYENGKSALITEISEITNNEFDPQPIYAELAKGNISKAFSMAAEYIKKSIISLVYNRNNIMSTMFALLCIGVLVSVSENTALNKGCSALLCTTLSAVLIRLFYSVFTLAVHTLTSLFSLMRVALPLFMGISAAGGKGAAAAADGVFIWFAVLFGRLCSLLLPSVTIALCAVIVSSFGFSFEKISKFIFGLINWCLGIFGVLFTALLKLTAVGAANFDFAALSGVKFAISHGIPVIGGFVSDSANALIGAALIIRNSLGLLTSVVTVIICAAPCVYIFAVFLLLKFMCAVCSAFCENPCCVLVEGFASCICELTIILLSGCVLFIIGTAIVLSSFGV